jgi:hypothetical protein
LRARLFHFGAIDRHGLARKLQDVGCPDRFAPQAMLRTVVPPQPARHHHSSFQHSTVSDDAGITQPCPHCVAVADLIEQRVRIGAELRRSPCRSLNGRHPDRVRQQAKRSRDRVLDRLDCGALGKKRIFQCSRDIEYLASGSSACIMLTPGSARSVGGR